LCRCHFILAASEQFNQRRVTVVHEHNQSLEQQLEKQLHTVISSRLGGIESEIQKLQTSFNEACQSLLLRAAARDLTSEETSQLRQSLASGGELQSKLSAAEAQITSLQAQLAASQNAGTVSSSLVNFGSLHKAIADLDGQRSQAEALACLVRHAASFAPRVVFFVIKGGNAIGWKASGFSNGLTDESVRSLAVSVNSAALLRNAVEQQRSFTVAGTEAAQNSVLGNFSAPQAESALAVPLTVRGKVAAVLYADSGSENGQSIQSEALEALLRVTSLIVELLPVRRSSEVAQRPAEAQTPAPVAPPAPVAASAPEVRATAAPAVSVPTPSVAAPVFYGGMGDEAPAAAAAPSVVEAAALAAEPAFAKVAAMPEIQPQPAVEESQPTVQEAAIVAEPAPAPVSAPAPAPTKPAGSAQRGPTLPSDAGDAEVRAHNDAKRFARLLVSEIKLYNEAKVNEGRRNGDLYERLKEDIDRSRQMYEKRVQPSVASRYDYFYDELLHTLGEGDPDKLGSGCPGPTVPLN
jgi:hypothetical protein